jgi:hypothetical protein
LSKAEPNIGGWSEICNWFLGYFFDYQTEAGNNYMWNEFVPSKARRITAPGLGIPSNQIGYNNY